MVSDPDELGRLLLRRYHCLQVLETDRHTKRSLVDQLDIPRSTLDGIMQDLEAAGLVAYTDGEWHATVLGQCALHAHEQYRTHLDSLTNIAGLSDALSPKSPITCDFLVGADVYEAESAVPDAVLEQLMESVADGRTIRGFTPMAISAYVEPFYTRAVSGDNSELELILPPDVFERIRAMYPDQTEEALHRTQVSLLQGSIPVSFGLWIVDDTHAGLVVYAEQGVCGLIMNDTAEALAWAEDQYERVKQDAEPIFLRGGGRHTPRLN